MAVTNPLRMSAKPPGPDMAFLRPLFERLAERAGAANGLPFVTLSYAQSIDGSIAARPARPVALSSQQSFLMTHLLRSRHCALLVGIETILADDPQLTVRLCAGADPRPVVLDSRLRVPLDAKILAKRERRPLLLTTAAASPERIERLEARGASVRVLPCDPLGRVDLSAALRCLAEAGVSCLMVEGGAKVIASFLHERLVDYCVITVAPRLMFGGLKTMEHAPAPDAPPIAIVDCAYQPLGGDLVIHGRVGGQ